MYCTEPTSLYSIVRQYICHIVADAFKVIHHCHHCSGLALHLPSKLSIARFCPFIQNSFNNNVGGTPHKFKMYRQMSWSDALFSGPVSATSMPNNCHQERPTISALNGTQLCSGTSWEARQQAAVAIWQLFVDCAAAADLYTGEIHSLFANFSFFKIRLPRAQHPVEFTPYMPLSGYVDVWKHKTCLFENWI